MAKTKISEYDATAGNNTDIDSISIAEGMLPSNVNNALRELMAHLKDMDAGTQALTSPQLTSVDINGGTIDGAVIGGNSAAAISGTTLALSGNADLNGDLDVDGTTNLDIVDIDGAVNMATTALVTGVLTTTAATVFNGGFASNAASTITTADNLAQLTLISTDADASSGPQMTLYRNSSSPADNDFIGRVKMIGRNDNSQDFVGVDMIGRIIDASDGTEDSEFRLATIRNGTESTDFKITPTEVVFNEDHADLDFRVESNGDADMLFVDGGANRIGIGTEAPAGRLEVAQAQNTTNQFTVPHIALTADATTDNTGFTGISYATSVTNNYGFTVGALRAEADADPYFVFNSHDNSASGTEVMRLTAANEILIGKTVTTLSTQGVRITNNGQLIAGRASAAAMTLSRSGSGDGGIANFYKTNTLLGIIGSVSDTDLYIAGNRGTDSSGIKFTDQELFPVKKTGATQDGILDVGHSGGRFDDIYATNGTIQTSDRNEKQDIAALTSAEMLVAKRISVLFKTFRWKDKVAAKGDNARTHSGIVAQDVQAAFAAESLDAGDYSMFISTTWWEHSFDVDAVEADDTVEPAIEAADAYTHMDVYKTEDEAPSGSTKKTRLGIRYPELLSFLAAYNEQRFAAIETRLTALEG